MRFRIPAVLLSLLAATGLSRADTINFSITSIDVPGATSTQAIGINNAGQIVGNYVTAGQTHGFIETNGVFTTLDVPASTSTMPTGINNVGQIVGFYTNSTGSHVFLDTNGTFSNINVPASISNGLSGPGQVAINDLGQIVGTTTNTRAFVYSNGQLALIPPLFDFAPFNAANGINNAGAIAGAVSVELGVEGFVFQNGTYISRFGLDEDAAYGINNLGDVVDNSGNGGPFGLLPATFLIKNGAPNPLPPFPGPFPPQEQFFAGFGRGLNDSDQIVGTYFGSFGMRGFLATPTPEPASLLLFATGVVGIGFLMRRRR